MRERPCILIVDDHRPSADALRDFLRSNYPPSWEFLAAYSANDAIDLIKCRSFDAVITDWKLNEHNPSETGFLVIEEARKNDLMCVTILVTAFPEEFERYKDAFPKGIYDCILKTQRGVVVADEIELKLRKALRARWDHESAHYYARHIDHTLRETLGATGTQSKLTRRWLTIMFANIRGFSKLSEQLRAHPDLMADFLQQLYTTIVECAHAHNGIVDKFMGDAAMLLFGVFDQDASHTNSDHAKRATRSAILMQASCAKLISDFHTAARRLYPGRIGDTQLGIGINTTEVLVGLIRTKDRDQFTAVGHGVTIAQRFERRAASQNEAGGSYGRILVTSTVAQRIASNFALRQETDLRFLPNTSEPHEVWSVLHERPEADTV